MRTIICTSLLLFFCISCNHANNAGSEIPKQNNDAEVHFDKSMWSVKKGKDYPFRDQMLNDLVYTDTIRRLNEKEIMELLGNPNRSTDGYLYYIITQKRLGSWPLHTKTMVIKFSNDSTVEWIKIHE